MNKEEIEKMSVNDKKGFSQAILYRLLPSLLVFILALLAFNNGVYLEDKPNICTDPLFVQIYYTIGLFLLAGIDFGMPMGGSEFYRILLYISYFLAPLITVLAVIEAVLKTIGTDYLKRPFKNHVVIIGASKEAISIIHSWNDPYTWAGEINWRWKKGSFFKRFIYNSEFLRSILIKHLLGGEEKIGYYEYTKLIVVEKDPNNTKLEYFRELSKQRKVEIIIGDINHSRVINSLNIGQALNCILTTNSDILNINIALKLINDYGVKERIITRVEDNDLIPVISLIQDGDDALHFRLTTTHRKLANCFLYRYIQTFLFLENLVIFGFGTFGQNILESISTSISFKNLIIIDPDAEQKYKNWVFKKKLYDEDFNPSYIVKTYNNKQQDSQIIESIKKKYNKEQCVHFIMCAKLPDYANIKLATNIAESFKNSIIYLRSQATLYEKLIGIDSRNSPSGLEWFTQMNKEEKSKKIIKNKFIYGGYFRGTIEDGSEDKGLNTNIDGQELDSIPNYKKVFSKPRYSNIHLFNELAELKNEHEFFNDLINPEISLSGHWQIDLEDGFLKLDNFNKDSEGNQKFIFKIE